MKIILTEKELTEVLTYSLPPAYIPIDSKITDVSIESYPNKHCIIEIGKIEKEEEEHGSPTGNH